MKNFDVLVFDFDRTLFDDDAFVSAIMSYFKKRGATDERLLNAYARIKKEGNMWSPFLWAEYIFGVCAHDLKKELEELLETTDRYMYKDVVPFLEMHSTQKMILSYGDSFVQRKKIAHSGVAHHFDPIVITEDDSKVSCFYGKLSNQKVLFIDDRAHVIDAVKTSHPLITCARIMRPGSSYNNEASHKHDIIVTTLSDLNEMR